MKKNQNQGQVNKDTGNTKQDADNRVDSQTREQKTKAEKRGSPSGAVLSEVNGGASKATK
ncbi:hypothetical protein [Lacimicrobium alkaliphilum]|uniref:SMP domain-containing protein n=1 Tax=Lacimicrobium alkaliphilum TaxID=1526571 RepID=A0ABQ1R4D5_9ALTE|nr:hypothetical protein [Lacimicrobium alkaliphilum]GGD54508.1 hypothetical protein GCM10011357_07770 [Lacimicrobium alkaliphilum]